MKGECTIALLAQKWAIARRNSVLALRDLRAISTQYDTEECEQALKEYRDIIREDFDDAEEYKDARDEAWDEFVECLEGLAGEEEEEARAIRKRLR